VISRDAAHRYTYEGVQYPGVTTILGVLDKSGPLMAWAARETATAAVHLACEESAGLANNALTALIDTVGEAGAIKALSSRSSWTRDEAAQLGTEVHALADLVVRGEPTPSMTETQRGRVLHYAEWWKGQLAKGAKLRLSEAMVVRPNDPDTVHTGWGGTFDLLYYDGDGCTVLADIKTGKGVYKEAVLQLAAYGMAPIVQPAYDSQWAPPAVTTYPMPLPDKYKIIHVTAEGCREIDLDIGTPERMAFLAALDLYHWTESMKGKRL
jgi:hypothetical protein